MMHIKKKFGYTGAPVTSDGNVGSTLIGMDDMGVNNVYTGMVTSRDFDFIDVDAAAQKKIPITDIMVSVDKLTLGYIEDSLEVSQKQLKKHRIGKLPIVNKQGELVALLCRSDLLKVWRRTWMTVLIDCRHVITPLHHTTRKDNYYVGQQ